jgi:hypothetical protein
MPRFVLLGHHIRIHLEIQEAPAEKTSCWIGLLQPHKPVGQYELIDMGCNSIQ